MKLFSTSPIGHSDVKNNLKEYNTQKLGIWLGTNASRVVRNLGLVSTLENWINIKQN